LFNIALRGGRVTTHQDHIVIARRRHEVLIVPVHELIALSVGNGL
jgi:hypothetical protein